MKSERDPDIRNKNSFKCSRFKRFKNVQIKKTSSCTKSLNRDSITEIYPQKPDISSFDQRLFQKKKKKDKKKKEGNVNLINLHFFLHTDPSIGHIAHCFGRWPEDTATCSTRSAPSSRDVSSQQ